MNEDMNKIISTNLKKLLKEYNINQNDLSKIAKVSESAVGKWILGKSTPRMGAIQRIADHFGLPKSYILNESIPENMKPITSEFVKVPILGEISCGDPILAEENIQGYAYEFKENLPSGEVFHLIAKGDSMEPTIPNGANVLIRSQSDVESGEIAAVLVNGDTEATLKRVKKQNGSIVLVPDNPEHDVIVITEKYPARIIGKAIRYTNDL